MIHISKYDVIKLPEDFTSGLRSPFPAQYMQFQHLAFRLLESLQRARSSTHATRNHNTTNLTSSHAQ